MTQRQQGVRSTKPKPPKPPISTQSPPEDRTDESITINNGTPTYEFHVIDEIISNLYSDDCGRFTIKSCSGKQYTMIAYHCDSNTILQASFYSRSDKHCIPDFNSIMERLRQRGHKVNHQVMDNKCSSNFKRFITEDRKANFHLVLPDMHLRNITKRDIQTFKAQFLAILAGVDSAFRATSGTRFFPRLKSISIFSISQRSILSCPHGNISTAPSTSLPLPWVLWAAASSYTTNHLSENIGITGDATDSMLDLP